MQRAPKGLRRQIAIMGRCNTGKSTILNRIAGQEAAMVADTPGTTADPVPLSFELLPLGPVTFFDTAGLDETGPLGEQRRAASMAVLERADMAVLVTDGKGLGPLERELIGNFRRLSTPFLIIFNKQNEGAAPEKQLEECRAQDIPFLCLEDGRKAESVPLREALLDLGPGLDKENPLLIDLVPEDGLVLLVVPIDVGAPKGRIGVPQGQVLRELLDGRRLAVTVQDTELDAALATLNRPPDLVVTDSQVVQKVAATLSGSIPLTTFSLLFSRFKGDFALQAEGARAIDRLQPGARILVAEACSHHPQPDDIGRYKIPRLLERHLGFPLEVGVVAGRDFPADLAEYSLVLHCGGCMLNRREMRRRLALCREANVPVTNYGMAISAAQGLLERVMSPFNPS